MPMSSSKKFLQLFSTLGALLVAGGATALAAQLYRRPWETAVSIARAGMLLTGACEKVRDIDDLPMHFYHAGSRGTPLLLIHGLGGSAEGWALLLPLLSSRYDVYALDLPGFGKTPLAPKGTNIRTHVHYVKGFLESLGHQQVVLVGNSLGGWVATRVAIEQPQLVKHLYLLNSAGLTREGGHSPYAPTREAARHSIERMWHYPFPVPSFVLDAFVRNSQRPAYAGFIQTYNREEELDAVLAHVHVPTTILWGTQDQLLSLTCAYELHNGIAHSKLILLPHAGHTPQTGAARQVAKIILEDAIASA